MVGCMRCRASSAVIPEVGTLHLAPPLAHTLGTLRRLADRAGFACEEPSPGLLALEVGPGDMARLAPVFEGGLSAAELRDTRALIRDGGDEPGTSGLVDTRTLAAMLGRATAGWLVDMIRDDRLTAHFQPILRASGSGTFAHECLLRGVEADGSLVPPSRLYRAARGADLLFSLDRAARMAGVREAARHGLDRGDAKLFLNFNPTSIYDPKYCLRSTVAAIAETGLTPDRIVFEIVESDHIDDLDHLTRIAAYYRAAGFGVALDDLGAGYGSLNLLGVLRPDFVKLDMQLVRGVDRDPFKAVIVAKLLEMARGLGIATVAEGIEDEEEWRWLQAEGIDFVQGYYFARPASPPPAPRLLHRAATP